MTLALFLSLLVKSSLIAAAGLIVARFVARRAVDRVDILRTTVCLLLAPPVLAAVLRTNCHESAHISATPRWADHPSRRRARRVSA